MQTIKDLLNKIKWDKRENPKDYEIVYVDRITKKEIKVLYKRIKKIEGNFLVLEEAEIPLHRITKVKKKRRIIWKR